MGRPSKYTQELADEICTRIADGESLHTICAESDKPARSTVLLWVVNDREGFSDQYTRAQEAQGSSDADKTRQVYDKLESKQLDPQSARVMFDILRWSAERRAPKRYGQKQEIDHRSGDGSMTPKPGIDVSQLSTDTLSELVNAKRSAKSD